MIRDNVGCRRHNHRFAEPEPLRDPEQPFQHRDAEQLDERVRRVSQDEQLRARRFHGASEARKGFTAAATVATLKFMEAEVSLSCEGIERYLGQDEYRVHALRG